MINVYGKPEGFKRATSSAAGNYVNTDPGTAGGIDADIAGQFQGGICAGITTAWVVAFLSGDADASSTAGFQSYFDNMLKFQGAYIFNFKSKQGVSTSTHGMEKFLDPMRELGVPPGVHKTKEENVQLVGSSIFPDGNWAAYTVIPGHAIGIGAVGGSYYAMDPNYGLHSYSDKIDFLLDLNYLYGAFRNCFGLDSMTDRVKLFFYAAGSRARR
jgi:hypothetical protein